MGFLSSTCAICEMQITAETPILNTSGCAFPESHHLWKYCDTGLHQECLAKWNHRPEFSEGYFGIRGAVHLLQETEQWVLLCGPVMYGPHGKVQLPYYAEIRLRDWPVRLYSRFHEWSNFVAERQWESKFIPQLNQHIQALSVAFPESTAALEDLLLPKVVAMLECGPEHRTRYVAALALELFGERARVAEPQLRHALNDEHGSVRQAAHVLLKAWQA